MVVPLALRNSAEVAARGLGLLGALERRMRGGLTALMYHRVLPDADCRDYPFRSLAMPESLFRAQMAWLAEHTDVLPLGAALERLERGPPSARPLVSVTFDDGYADNFDRAAPIAEKHGLRCTFFVATEFIGDGRALWFDRAHALLASTTRALAREAWCRRVAVSPPPDALDPGAWIEQLKRLQPAAREAFLRDLSARCERAPGGSSFAAMSPLAVRALARLGHEIASHGTRHSVLRALCDTELEQELCGSRLRLEQWLGRAPDGLAYPDGAHDARVIAAARQAGYRWACTTRRGIHRRGGEPLAIPRRAVTASGVGNGHGDFLPLAFRSELCGLRDGWRRLRSV